MYVRYWFAILTGHSGKIWTSVLTALSLYAIVKKLSQCYSYSLLVWIFSVFYRQYFQVRMVTISQSMVYGKFITAQFNRKSWTLTSERHFLPKIAINPAKFPNDLFCHCTQCTNNLSSLHISSHHCTFCASLHVKTSPALVHITIVISKNSKAQLESQAKGTSLSSSIASGQRSCAKGSP